MRRWKPPSRLGLRESSLLRRRQNGTVDLLLGLASVAGIASLIASVTPVLALVFVVAVIGGYLVSLRHREVSRGEIAKAPRADCREAGGALDALDDALAKAPVIPLTGLVRLDPRKVSHLVDEVRVAAATSEASDQADELARVILGDRPVPMARQLRVDREQARRSMAALRSILREA